MIEYRNVSRKIGKFLLSDIEFELQEGYMLGIVGKNGAGKTTLLRCLMDEKQDYYGDIFFHGKSIKENHETFMQDVGYVSEDNPFLMTFTGEQNANLYGVFYEQWNSKLFEQTMEKFQVPVKRKLKYLSRGEFMKFQLAFALSHGTKCFVIDEATAGMDPIFRREFYQILRKAVGEDAVALVTSHIQSDIEKYMDYIGVVESGEMVSFEENLQ